MTVTVARLLFGLGLGSALAACGSKETPPPAVAPALADDTSQSAPTPAPAPVAEVPAPVAEVPAPASAPSFLAWRYDNDGQLETALVSAKPVDDDQTPPRKGDVVATFGPNVYKLGSDVVKIPVKPCDEAEEANFVTLGLTGIEPPKEITRVEIADAARRPQRDEARIHMEKLMFLGQAGPFVWVHHEMNSDICPIPGTGAVYDVYRVVDIRDGRSVAFTDIYGDDELATLKKTAFEAVWTAIKADYADAPDDVKAALTLGTIDCGWGDDGALACKANVYASHKHFADPDDEEVAEGVAGASVPAAVPGCFLEYGKDKAPDVVVAFWKGGAEGGRGFSAVPDAAADGLRAWFLASAAKDAATPTP